jgi:regulatory protein YycH of two-component signal transduction system YycFG
MIIALLVVLVLLLTYLNWQIFINFTLPKFKHEKEMLIEYKKIIDGKK